MALTVTSYTQSSDVVIADTGGRTDYEPLRQDLQLRAVPGTVINGVQFETDGRARPTDLPGGEVKLPSQLRGLLPLRGNGGRITGWARRTERGEQLNDTNGWRLSPLPLYGQTYNSAVPGTPVDARVRMTHMFQIGETPLSLNLSEHAPGNRAITAEARDDLPYSERLRQLVEHLQERFGAAQLLPSYDTHAHTLFSNPATLIYSRLYYRSSSDQPWTPRHAGQLDGKHWTPPPELNYLGGVVQADIGKHLTLLKRQGHPSEPQVPVHEQTLLIFGDGHQIADPTRASGIRTMPIPLGTKLAHVAPSGCRAEGSLAEVAERRTAYGFVNATHDTHHDQFSITGTRVNGHMDDLKFKAPAPHGQVDAFDPTQTFAINDAAFVAADHPDIAILMVKPGHSVPLSQMMDELKVAGLHYSRVVVVSGRASPSTLGSPVHRLADNAVPH